jgi:hypothetical protein
MSDYQKLQIKSGLLRDKSVTKQKGERKTVVCIEGINLELQILF